MIIAHPSPLHRIARLDRNRAGNEPGAPALSDSHVRRRRGSEDGKEDGEKGEQSDMHFSGLLGKESGAAD